MEGLRQKQPRAALEPKAYDKLKIYVLERDRWKCQGCGSTMNLQVHHLESRAQLGSDVPDNLLTLCADCHRGHHHNI